MKNLEALSCTTRKCTTLWGEPDRVHAQNMEQLHAFDCHQNVAEPQATENHKIYTHVHRNCESGLVIIYKLAAHRRVQHRLQVVEMACVWTWTCPGPYCLYHCVCVIVQNYV